MRHFIYYQGQVAQFETFCEAYTYCLILKRDFIEYVFVSK
jgi:hypothetical protein